MRSFLHWFVFGVFVLFGATMVCLGVFFLRNVCVSFSMVRGQVLFSSIVLGVMLLLVGCGILCSTVSRSVKRRALSR
jgi:hypothetical protein